MTIPSFAAEASLYRSRGRYHTGSSFVGTSPAVVSPAATFVEVVIDLICYSACYTACRTVRDHSYCVNACRDWCRWDDLGDGNMVG